MPHVVFTQQMICIFFEEKSQENSFKCEVIVSCSNMIAYTESCCCSSRCILQTHKTYGTSVEFVLKIYQKKEGTIYV